MSYQDLFNLFVGVIGAIGGWMLNRLQESLKSLHTADTELAQKVQSIEVVVAGQYVKRDEFQSLVNALFAKLDKIDDKINNKVDKTH